jgi:putative chitobiose transport system permease protein
MSERPQRPRRLTLRFFAAAAVGIIAIFPLWWALISALRPERDIFRYLSPLSLWTFLPNSVTLRNFSDLSGNSFVWAMVNSLIVSTATVVVGLVLCAMAGFALAKLRFPFKRTIFIVIVISFLVPFDAIAVPLAGIFRFVGLQNSYTGLILPGIGNGFAVFLLRQFFLGVPDELAEAGRVDGLGWFGIFRRIYVPLSRPALIAAGLILFVFQWQSFLWPLLIAPDPTFKVASVAIADFAGQFNVAFGKTFGAAIFVSIVPMVILLVFQRYFVSSFATSGMKD